MSGIYLKEDADVEVLSIGEGSEFSYERTPPKRSFGVPPIGHAGPALGTDLLINRKKVNSEIASLHSSISGSLSGTEESEYTEESGEDYAPRGRNNDDSMANRLAGERHRIEEEQTEKQEILYQLERLESKGIRLSKKFTMQSELDEMRSEYHRLKREKEVGASIRFQRRMLIAVVSGVEYVNDRFDPFDVQLDGFSVHVNEGINDYDDIFEELHEKYKGTGSKMPPELRLLMSLGGSAVMYHLTQSMIKRSKVPEVEDVLRSDPALMKQFENAAAKRMGSGGGAGGIFGMLGNLFGGSSNGNSMSGIRPPAPPPQNGGGMGAGRPTMTNPSYQPEMTGPSTDVDDMIAQIHEEIHRPPQSYNSNRFETISTISDEEITSIIEESTDLNGLLGSGRRGRGGRKPSNKRTLEL